MVDVAQSLKVVNINTKMQSYVKYSFVKAGKMFFMTPLWFNWELNCWVFFLHDQIGKNKYVPGWMALTYPTF